MQDRASSASKQTPFHQRPGFLKICLAVVSIAFLWVVFAEDHEDWEDFADEAYMVDPWAIPGSPSGMPDVAAQPGFIQAPRGGYEDYTATASRAGSAAKRRSAGCRWSVAPSTSPARGITSSRSAARSSSCPDGWVQPPV